MIFCRECFRDTEIKSIINGLGQNGDCEICGKKNVHIYDTSKNTELIVYFEGLINIYSSSKSLPLKFPKSEVDLLKNEMIGRWNIFNNISNTVVHNIITTICKEKYEECPELFDEPIGIAEMYDEDYIFEHSLVKTNNWDNFVEELKMVNRFHTNYINFTILEQIFSYIRKSYKKGTVFYRGRVSLEQGHSIEEMGPPPSDKATAGRANSQGISCLYLASDVETTIHEVRAGAFDYITVAKFELQRDIIVLDLKSIDKISPFIETFDKTEHAINKNHLNKIHEEMSRTLRRSDNVLDYLGAQYISDFIKSLAIDEGDGGKYAGIEYESTMNKKGFNLAIYYSELFKCIETDIYNIQELKYRTVHCI